MTLVATVVHGVLTVDGEAARASPYSITVSRDTVIDDGPIALAVSIDTDHTNIRKFDLSDLTGAGARIYFSFDKTGSVVGSDQSDQIYINSGFYFGAASVTAGKGDDSVTGGGFDDSIQGGAGNDHLSAGAGDDRLVGGAGDDTIDGGDGDDTAIFSGRQADYDLSVRDDAFVLTDLRSHSPTGVDVIGNVEHLQFSDGIFDLPSLPTNLSATVSQGVFTIDGQAARNGPYSITVSSHLPMVSDDGIIPVAIPVDADGSIVTRVDVSGLQGAGALITLNTLGRPGSVVGSSQDDQISAHGGAMSVSAGDGNDSVVGSDASDTIDGGAGNDFLRGGNGADRLVGGAGDDTIDGGAGDDTAVFSGRHADYDLSIQDGAFVLTDLRAQSPTGVDVIGDVEHLQFSDGVFDLTGSPTTLTATVSQGVLTVDGEAGNGGPYVDISGSENFPSVTDSGAIALAVPVASDGVKATKIDLSGLQGAGARIVYSISIGTMSIVGSDQDDAVFLSGRAQVVLGNGDDTVGGSYGVDWLHGGNGNDSLSGDNSSDRLVGGAGNDTIDGGYGDDTAIFSGRQADYDLSIKDGVFFLQDLRAHSPSGSDYIANVEHLQFSDGVFDMPDLNAQTAASLSTHDALL